MTSPKQEPKFGWHVHHNVLMEPLTEPIEDRIVYIKVHKPKKEIPLRLKLLKVVKGKLPEKFVEAWKACDKVRKALEELKKAYVEVENAWVDALKTYKKEISALHKEECPECPWDGKTIFSKKPTTP